MDGARHTSIRRVPIREGIKARPFPATIMLDRDERGGDGVPVLDPAKARAFYERVRAEIERALREVFEGWQELREQR